MVKKRDEIKDLKQFGFVFAGILLVAGTINFFKGRVVWYTSFFSLGLVAISLALVTPKSLKPVYIIFTKIAHAIGWFNTRLILILIYFVIVTPMAILLKISGKDPLNRKIDKNEKSCWIKRPITRPAKESLEKQF